MHDGTVSVASTEYGFMDAFWTCPSWSPSTKLNDDKLILVLMTVS